jgi:uncharacterized protein (DUF427 family)
MRAIWNNTILAESDKTIVVDGNHYFPPVSLRREYFEPGAERSTCPWKGHASYYDIVAAGKRNVSAAWYYPDPYRAATHIAGYVAFWRGVEVSE